MATPLSPQTLVYGLASADDPQISPDGSRIVYALTEGDAEAKKIRSQLWLCGVDGGGPRRLTFAGEHNAWPRWSPDGRWIAFVSDRAPKSGVFVMPMEGGEPRELVRHAGEITSPAWSPDGTAIAYIAPYDPAEPPGGEESPQRIRITDRIDYKQDGRGYLGDIRWQLFVIGVDGGQPRRLTSEAVDHESPRWSPDGRWLAVRIPKHNGMHSQLGVVSAKGGQALRVGPADGVLSTWVWSPDGKRIVYSGDVAQTWQTDFFMYEIGPRRVRRITTDLQCLPTGGSPGLSEPSQPVWLDARRIAFHAMRGGASGIYALDVESGDVETMASFEALSAGFSVDAEARLAVQSTASLASTGEITAFDFNSKSGRVVTQLNRRRLLDSPPAGWEKFEIDRDDFTIEAWLLRPPDFDPSAKYPVILDIHGGPHSYYGYGFSLWQQCFATNGYLVVYANPRGSGSYGRDFTKQVFRDWGGEDYLDLLAVVDKVLERPYADRERLGVWGYSYGGYMTAWCISQSNRFRAAVCGAPVFDLQSMYGTSDIGHSFGDIEWGGAEHTRRDWFAARSPATFAHNTRTPTLIIHGEADERCPIGQGEQMFVALKKAGCEVVFARYPGVSHGFLRSGEPEQRVDGLARSLAWFDAHLK